MKIQYSSGRKKNKAEKKERWFSRLWDSTKRVATKVACVVTIPTLVFIAGCKEKAPGTENLQDGGTPDALVQHDAGVDAQQPDAYVPVCENLQNKTEVKNLIGDYLNRDLEDREDNMPNDMNSSYPFETPEMHEDANPFADGTGGSIGPTEMFFYRITGELFTPIATTTIMDNDAAKEYTEKQDIWMNGYTAGYNIIENDVTGHSDFIAYSMKFNDGQGFGIPVCTLDATGDYNYCKSGEPGVVNYDHATESHKVKVYYHGTWWVLTEMSPPVIDATSESQVYNGGYVKLAKEALSGILNAGESLPHDGLKFRLVDLEEHGGVASAIIAVLDANDNVLIMDTVQPGQTKEFNLNGNSYLFHVYKVAPGYTMGAKWADVAILADELMVMDGEELDADSGRFEHWKVSLGWKNKEVTATSTNPDHLRTIVIWTDQVDDILGREYFARGSSLEIVENFTLCYGGLDITDEDREDVRFDLRKNSPRVLTDAMWSNTRGDYVDCVINPPYMEVSTSATGDWFMLSDNGTVSVDDEFYVALNNLDCGNGEMVFGSGSLIIKSAPNSDNYVVYEYAGPDLTVGINVVDQPEGSTMGGISWSKWSDCTAGSGSLISMYVPRDPSQTYVSEPEFVFAVYENARSGSDVMLFAFDGQSINTDVQSNITSLFREGNVTYSPAGPMDLPDMTYFERENFITERGSVVRTISDDNITLEIPTRVAYSVFYVGTEE